LYFFNFQSVFIILALAAVACSGQAYYPAGTHFTRAPKYDSAVIKSDRLGGNFAYSVAESHAYAAHTPIVQNVAVPTGVSYSAGAPTVSYHAAPSVAYSAPTYGHYGYSSYPAATYGAYGYGAYPSYLSYYKK